MSRRKFDQEEQRKKIFARDGWCCRICGRPLSHPGAIPQLAHRIPQRKHIVKKFGEEVIHHPLNLWSTCSLTCNDHAQIRDNEEKALLLQEIYFALRKD